MHLIRLLKNLISNYIKNKLTMEQKELTYVSPEVEVIEVEVEQGFQASGEDVTRYPLP